MMPWPFSRGVFIYGDPIRVDAEAGEVELERARSELERRLNDITERADRFFESR